jgi:hypothetical protein
VPSDSRITKASGELPVPSPSSRWNTCLYLLSLPSFDFELPSGDSEMRASPVEPSASLPRRTSVRAGAGCGDDPRADRCLLRAYEVKCPALVDHVLAAVISNVKTTDAV